MLPEIIDSLFGLKNQFLKSIELKKKGKPEYLKPCKILVYNNLPFSEIQLLVLCIIGNTTSDLDSWQRS